MKDNAFEQGYQDISFGTGFTEAMIHNGVAAMELMGDWDIGFFQGYYPGWVASNHMGIGFFPAVPGGAGNPADLEGNTTSYVELAAHISPRIPTLRRSSRPGYSLPRLTRRRDQPRPGTGHRGYGGLLRLVPIGKYLLSVTNAVQKAPYFQYSWDKASGPTRRRRCSPTSRTSSA